MLRFSDILFADLRIRNDLVYILNRTDHGSNPQLLLFHFLLLSVIYDSVFPVTFSPPHNRLSQMYSGRSEFFVANVKIGTNLSPKSGFGTINAFSVS